MNVTDDDLENSFIFDNKSYITSYVHFLIYVYKYIVIESQFMYEL